MLVPSLSFFLRVVEVPVPLPQSPPEVRFACAAVAAGYWVGWSPRRLVDQGVHSAQLVHALGRVFPGDVRPFGAWMYPGPEALFRSLSAAHAAVRLGLGLEDDDVMPRNLLRYARVAHWVAMGGQRPPFSRSTICRAGMAYQAGVPSVVLGRERDEPVGGLGLAALSVTSDRLPTSGQSWCMGPRWRAPWEAAVMVHAAATAAGAGFNAVWTPDDDGNPF